MKCFYHGDVLYCPDCVKTWKERNGAEYDKQYKNPPHLFAMWWNRQVQMQITDKSKIKTYYRNDNGDYVDGLEEGQVEMEVHNGNP